MEKGRNDTGILGIDAGGTFTDLAFLSGSPLEVTAKVKTPTIHENIVRTIENGIDLILQQVEKSRIRAVNLATTLATNAIVENKLRTMAVILIGYDREAVEKARKKGEFGTDFIYMIDGGHDARGNEIHPLDEEKLCEVIDGLNQKVDSIAVSGYFSVRNTSHELRAREIIHEKLPEIHVTCGHELATDLDAVKRATTASLNAGLIPIIMELLSSVEKVCKEREIYAPVTVVRGDGSLVSADWAGEHPIEMVLSGPASSACGACYLARGTSSGRKSWAVDIGGTTTDIIHLGYDGKPALNQNGSFVGRHHTLVKAIDIYTFGLGGDSRIRFDHDWNLLVGPRRIRPLCVMAQEYPDMRREMTIALRMGMIGEPLFALPGQYAGRAESKFEKRILKRLEDGPHLVYNLVENEVRTHAALLELEKMEDRGLIEFSGFTPTDIFHVFHLLDKWDREASVLGAKIMAIRGEETAEEFSRKAYDKAVEMIAFEVFRKSLNTQGCSLLPEGEGERILKLALRNSSESNGESSMSLRLNASLIGVGAPAWAFIEKTGKHLGEEAVLPDGAEVAGAVGAAIGSFSLDYVVLIHPLAGRGYRVHHPLQVLDYDDLETAVEETRKSMLPWIEERARKAGARHPKITFARKDEEARIAGGKQKIFLKTQLLFTVTDEESE